MRFHHIAFFTILALASAGASHAGEADDAQQRFAEQLDQRVEMQLAALVELRLAEEVEAIRVPSATPKALSTRRSTPVASATSARALPTGELPATRLACQASPTDSVDCTVAPDATRGAEVTTLAKKGI